MMKERDYFVALPKTALHIHLDGSLRIQTLWELAQAQGVTLPFATQEQFSQEIFARVWAKSLPRYLETFAWTTSVMQTTSALTRIARELVEDLSADGVCYAEIRFAPHLHTARGLSLHEVITAVKQGLCQGEEKTRVAVGLILCALRNGQDSLEVAQLAAAHKTGFDLAGPEEGFPPSLHAEALAYCKQNGVPVTLHAGEAGTYDSVTEALDLGAKRLGHGVLLTPELEERVLAEDILIEVNLTSNLQTGAISAYQEHPLPHYLDKGIAVAICTDNNLQSDTSHSKECKIASQTFGLTLADLSLIGHRSLNYAFF